MFQIPNSSLYIGNKEDAKNLVDTSNYCIVHACKSFFDTVENTENYKNNPKLKVFQNEMYVDWVDLPDPTLPDDFHSAITKFKEIYSDYTTPSGISFFVKKNWSKLGL